MGEAFIIKRGSMSSGEDINLTVVGGTTQPTNPVENTVWVNTDVEINSYDFSAVEPTNPTEGMVWFETSENAIESPSVSAPMNVSQKNNAMVYPVACKQYVGGTWVSKEAKTFKDGTWLKWGFYLYDQGNEFVHVSGGWQVTSRRGYADWTNKAPTLTKNADSMTISYTGNSSVIWSGTLETVNEIDLTPFSKVVVTLSASMSSGAMLYASCCKKTNTTSLGNAFVTGTWLQNSQSASNKEYTLNVSSVNQKACVCLVTRAMWGNNTVTVTKVELLK